MTPEELTEARKTIGSDCQESDLVCAIQEAGQSLLAHIDQQAKQIEALKEMLIKKQAVLNGWTHEAGFEYDPAMMDADEFTPATLEYARQQLAEELPEVDWE